VFLFHFYIFVYLDVNLKFEKRNYYEFFLKNFYSLFGFFIFVKKKLIILLYFPFLVSFVSIPFL